MRKLHILASFVILAFASHVHAQSISPQATAVSATHRLRNTYVFWAVGVLVYEDQQINGFSFPPQVRPETAPLLADYGEYESIARNDVSLGDSELALADRYLALADTPLISSDLRLSYAYTAADHAATATTYYNSALYACVTTTNDFNELQAIATECQVVLWRKFAPEP